MKVILAMLAASALAACGVETAGTAATAAGIKKQEMEQGTQTMQRAQEKIDQSMEQLRQRAADGGGKQP
jgi:curli biogenesis system outer membrane secretion channel CsgG